VKHQLLTCRLPLIDGAARGILIGRTWSPKEASSGAPRRHVARLARTARRREGPRGAMAAELRGGASRRRSALAAGVGALPGPRFRRRRLQAPTRALLQRPAGPARRPAGRPEPQSGRRSPYRPRMQQSQRPYRPRMLQGSRPKVAAGPSLVGGTALATRPTGGCAMRKERLRLVTEEKRGVRLGFRVSGQAPLIYIGRHQLPTVRSDQRSRSLHVRVCGQLGQMG